MEESLEYQLTARFSKKKLLAFINTDPKYFEQAIEFAISDEQPMAWRSAWLLGGAMSQNDVRLQNHVKAFIQTIKTRKDGHQRELLKILNKMDIDEDIEGYLFDICMTIWETITKSPSVRIKAFETLTKIAKKYPELNNEIEFLSEDHYTKTLSPGIKRSIEQFIKRSTLYNVF
jgi:hypothetical protein